MSSQSKFRLGIDIGGTNVKALVLDDRLQRVAAREVSTDAQRGAEAVLSDVRGLIASLCDEFPLVGAVGVGFPAVVDAKQKRIALPPNMPAWSGLDAYAELVALSDRPMVIDNDANVAALAEAKLGAGREHPDFLYVTLGTGVGGAIVWQSELFRGSHGGAGEIGHVIISADGALEDYGSHDARSFRRGVLERYTGREAILRRAHSLAKRFPNSVLNSHAGLLDVHHLSEAADLGDEAALICFQEIGQLLAIGVVSALHLLDFHTVIVGGGISRAHSSLLDSLAEEINLRCLPSLSNSVRILKAEFLESAGCTGAALIAGEALV